MILVTGATGSNGRELIPDELIFASSGKPVGGLAHVLAL
jgi:hypothetical protein